MAQPDYLEVNGRRIAYRRRDGVSPALVFFPGYASDMEGAKAVAIDAFAGERGLAMLRFDYSGTGSSSGEFAEGTLGRWIDEALALIDRVIEGPLVLVGSSMGGWVAYHVALRRGTRVRGILGIAAAPDFTEWGFTDAQKAEIQDAGRLEEPNPYGPEPQLTTKAFWQSGQQLLLGDRIAVECPVRLVHGQLDEDVPLAVAFRAMSALRSGDVQLLTIKGGGHRLSEPHEIDAILRTLSELLEQVR